MTFASPSLCRNISKGVVFFVVALATVLMKIASVTAHGLVAINWLLAGGMGWVAREKVGGKKGG